ncbi:hypothetical protein [Gandjariella thermophila]|uniref:Uncharacterized protein n=1 Tax=Gandjariella thermophila TaxID=1931992 RepID=A0A4D4J0W6_9PSEU|nr:hypothetical protein [Gandjariella thermophila]GDY28722.1 hypothetical protein GTS_03550 [Gandjariella thermophila]
MVDHLTALANEHGEALPAREAPGISIPVNVHVDTILALPIQFVLALLDGVVNAVQGTTMHM